MTEPGSQSAVVRQIAALKNSGVFPVVVHGGGPFIQKALKQAKITSEFVDGHRVTERDAMEIVEQALSGTVNGLLVKALNKLNANAVGLSGKDGGIVKAVKRNHSAKQSDGSIRQVNLGFVGDVKKTDPKLLHLLLDNNYLPVISPVSSGEDGEDYNINADMFAGHIAGALQADAFVAITNVDGLMEDPDQPDTKIESITAAKVGSLFGSVIQGGMIPKVEACLIAIEKGVKAAHIVSGSTERSILDQLSEQQIGTTIY